MRVARGEIGNQLQALALRGVREHRQRFFHQRHQVEVQRLELQMYQDSILEKSRISLMTPSRCWPEFCTVSATRSWGQVSSQRQLVDAEDPIGQCADFMAHHHKEFGFRAAGRFGSLLGAAQLSGTRLHLVLEVFALRRQARVSRCFDMVERAD